MISEKVLCCTKRVEAQRAQSAVMNSLTDTGEFDTLKIMKGAPQYSLRRPSAHAKAPTK